jgi:hypothetical protein
MSSCECPPDREACLVRQPGKDAPTGHWCRQGNVKVVPDPPARRLPRDRWIGTSPGGNVTHPGQALEALAAVRTACEGACHSPNLRPFAVDLLEIISRIMVAP